MATQNPGQDNLQLQTTPIAIIGMAALFPQARNLQEYWDNIIGKVDCISDVPATHWNIEDYYDPNPATPDKTYAKRGGFLPEIDFDPLEFGLPPDTLQALDSGQLLSLIVAKTALENAGYGKERDFNRETTGVILGASGLWKTITPLTARLQYPVWEKVLKSSGLSEEDTQKIIEKIKLAYVPWEENSFPGMLTNVVAGRITNRLDLGGTNCIVDAACASSLSAVKMAISELSERRCDLVITGGLDTDNSILNYMCFSKTPAFSKKDFLNPFDAESDGMMVGEGIGMLVLKRLDEAERDGDRIYALIKGIGTSSDGRYKSIYAPRPEGQVRALHRAYQNAGCSPTTVGLIEAHGTGTPAGDFCEFTALNQVFSENNPRKEHIALGSVKSQIGHTKAAAGAASLIKVALSLHQKVLPPTINVTQPNPKFKIDNSPFYLNTEARPWIAEGDAPRRAGVSSFGFGGTNFHVVLEEYRQNAQDTCRLQTVPQSMLLSARTPEQLHKECESVLARLESEAGEQHYRECLKACQGLIVPVEEARVGFVATSFLEAKKLLKLAIGLLKDRQQVDAWEHPGGIYYRKTGIPKSSKMVALFPGQGSQYLNMGKEVAINFPALKQAYEKSDALFHQQGLPRISQMVFPPPALDRELETQQTQTLQRTENAQPAIGAFSVGLYKILQQAGFQPDFVAGHSFGELTALWAAGVLSDRDYFFLVKARGRAMGVPDSTDECDAGAMLAVSGDIDKIQSTIGRLGRLKVANFNSPKQIVLSGAKPEIATIQQVLSKQGYSVTPLSVSAAFHSSFVSHAVQPFADALAEVDFQVPKLPVFSNTTGKPYPNDPQTIKTILQDHLLNPVHFKQEIENLYNCGGYCFVEIGPRQILTNLVKDILGDRPHLAIALNPNRTKNSDLQLRQGVMQLRVAGLPLIDFDPHEVVCSPPVTKKSRLQVSLNGSNYISDRTKAAFEKALQKQPAIAQAAVPKEIAATENPSLVLDFSLSNPTSEGYEEKESQSDSGVTDIDRNTISNLSIDNQPISTRKTEPMSKSEKENIPSPSQSSEPILGSSLDKLLTQFYAHQSEILRVHEQYLKIKAETPQAFLQMLQKLYQLLVNSSTLLEQATPEIVTSEAQNHNGNGNGNGKSAIALNLQEEIAWTPPSNPKTSNHSLQPKDNDSAVPSIFIDEKLSLSAVYPPESEISLNNGHSNHRVAPEPIPSVVKEESFSSPQVWGIKETEIDDSPSVKEFPITDTLLSVVSDKTGYPAAMLEMEMDLEADLGIDSIKRVEIMGAVQEFFPQLPKLSPEDLAEKRTLAEIAEFLEMQLSVAQKK